MHNKCPGKCPDWLVVKRSFFWEWLNMTINITLSDNLTEIGKKLLGFIKISPPYNYI